MSDGEDYDDDDQEYVYEEDQVEFDYDYDDHTDDAKLTPRKSPKESTSPVKKLASDGKAKSTSSQKGSQKDSSYLTMVPQDGYVIVSLSDIMPIMLSLIKEVRSLLDLSLDETQILLQSYQWDKEKLIDAFFADPEKVMNTSGLSLYNQISELNTITQSIQKIPSTDSNTTFECRICCDNEIKSEEAFHLGCKHQFCRDCFGEYLRNQVNDGPLCIIAHCAEHKCNQSITRSIYQHFLSPSYQEKYDIYLVKHFIDRSKNMSYCPAPRCEKVAIGSGITTVRCTCSNPFCFKCGEEAHDPCSCAQLSDWNAKCLNESETANWILANTRKCPECNTRIEKNQGCNHMTCRMCKYEFCWICMGNWVEHGQTTGGYYKCNRFEATAMNASASAAQKAKAELERYLHYYQ
eukprot:gene16115-21902_t